LKSKKRTISFLSESEIEESFSTGPIKCFRPKNINESSKTNLLKLIRRKSERSIEKIAKLQATAKNSLQWQMDSVASFRNQLVSQRKAELSGLFKFEHALNEIEMQILLVPTK
jgi:hypothetical protein